MNIEEVLGHREDDWLVLGEEHLELREEVVPVLIDNRGSLESVDLVDSLLPVWKNVHVFSYVVFFVVERRVVPEVETAVEPVNVPAGSGSTEPVRPITTAS